MKTFNHQLLRVGFFSQLFLTFVYYTATYVLKMFSDRWFMTHAAVLDLQVTRHAERNKQLILANQCKTPTFTVHSERFRIT